MNYLNSVTFSIIAITTAFIILLVHHLKTNRNIDRIKKTSESFKRLITDTVTIERIVVWCREPSLDVLVSIRGAVALIEYNFKKDEKYYEFYDDFQKQNSREKIQAAIIKVNEIETRDKELLFILEDLENVLLEMNFKLNLIHE